MRLGQPIASASKIRDMNIRSKVRIYIWLCLHSIPTEKGETDRVNRRQPLLERYYMSTIGTSVRSELLAASDAQIEDALNYADPMVLLGLLYQLTGDRELEAIGSKHVLSGYLERLAPATEPETELLRRKAADFLKAYRDTGAVLIDIGPCERLATSLGLMRAETIPKDAVNFYIEELGLDPSARALAWRSAPDPKRLANFHVVLIGAGMAGLNAALQLKRAGIPYTHVEKNAGVGGTWHENRYPGARVDSPSRSYTHTFGVNFPYPYAFCPWQENQKYFDWVADFFDLRKDIQFQTEARALTWNEEAAEWVIRVAGKDGQESILRANAVITAVGFLNRARLPEIEGIETFRGQSWHTSRWPEGTDLAGKRVAVVGTGCSGYQLIPELALEARQLVVFQRTPQWIFPVRGYRSPLPSQVNWLDRNLPFYTNFLRLGSGVDKSYIEATTIDPDFDDPHAVSAGNKRAREVAIAFLNEKLNDPVLVEAMTPPHPVWSARPVAVDPEYSVLDVICRDDVTLVTDRIRRIRATGIETDDGRLHNVDVIVFATGFHATEYLFPMTVTGKDGLTTEALWKEGGARAYLGCMIPGFPNLWTVYGPNTNGALPPASFHEMIGIYALQCIEELILEEKSAVEVRPEAYWSYNRRIDEGNAKRAWADPRARTYYWTKHGRSATQNPLGNTEMWQMLRYPDFKDFAFD
jgi:4-hydroxyacetophenone monooxygenase